MTDYVIFTDVETTINGGPKHGPHPKHPDNKIVVGGIYALGMTRSDDPKEMSRGNVNIYEPKMLLDYYNLLLRHVNDNDTITLVGHNIGFDLKHVGSDAIKLLHKSNVKLWDTMVAEYILNGQNGELPLTLEATCQRNGIDFKKDPEIAELFNSGKGADHADPAKLREYLSGDIETLLPLMVKQLERAQKQNQVKIIEMRQRALKALIVAEDHGMAFDKDVIIKAMPDMIYQLEKLKKALTHAVPGTPVVLDLTSPVQFGKFLYGGVHTVTYREPDGLYKNGKVRWRNKDKDFIVPSALPRGVSGSTDEEALLSLAPKYPIVKADIDMVLQYRELSKEVTTYCKNLLNLEINGRIYGNINTTVTATGRLSSSKPNLQNIKNGRLKAAFVSRYNGGSLIEIDFAQLEIIALAILSFDAQLISDILAGVDIHTALYHDMYGRTPTKEERKAFKPRTFSLVYGASAAGISRNAHISIGDAIKFIETFYRRYPGVKVWNEKLKTEWVGKSMPIPGMYPKAMFQHRSPTGLILTYYTGKGNTFSPTQLVNYPVQSLAADIVQTMIYEVFMHLSRNFPDALLVNVVHDSFVIDSPPMIAEEVARSTAALLRRTPLYLKEKLDLDTRPILEMGVGVSIGPNWADMEELV